MSEQRKRRQRSQKNTAAAIPSTAMNNVTDSVNLVELMYRLLASWKLIISMALILAIVTGVYTVFLVTPMYEATSTIYVLNHSDSAISLSDLQLGTALTQDYIKVFKIWEVHEEVISNLRLPYTYTEIKNMLAIKHDTNTRILDITITSPDANEAAAIANEYAKVVCQYIADTMSAEKPNIMSVALVPSKPVSPNKTRNVLIGFILGAIVACGYVTIVHVFDDKYKTAEDISRYTGLKTLAVVPAEPTQKKILSGKR